VEVAGADRLMMTNKMAIIQPIPISYLEKIKAVPGVALVSYSSWFGGIYQDPTTNVFQFAVEPVSYMEMYKEFKLPPEQMKAWLGDRQGCIVGKDLAARFNWKIGDKIPIIATFNRPKDGSTTWEFNIVGIYDGEQGVDKTQFLFRHDYLTENRQGGEGLTGWYLIKVSDPQRSAEIAKTIDAQFENSSTETKTATEKAMAQGFANQVGNIGYMVTSIAAVVLFTILLIAASQMSLAVRERTNEIGAMKAMGFSDPLILGLVLGESLTLALTAGAVGIGLAYLFSLGGDPTGGLLPIFMFKASDIAIGLGMAVVLGLIAGAMPAVGAMQLRIAEALRRS
jgi:putative ABC transport system permease protein